MNAPVPATVADFYLPGNAAYSLLDSAIDAARYTVAATMPCEVGANAHSFLTDIEGKPARTGGRLIQGIGYCADAPYGAAALFALGRFTGRPEFSLTAAAIARHAVRAGYLADPDVPVRLYRDAETHEFFDQLEARSSFFDVGHMAKTVENLVRLTPRLDEEEQETVIAAARHFASFVGRCARTPTGWLPRRTAHDMSAYRLARIPPHAPDMAPREDAVAETSGAGLLTLSCMLKLDQAGLADTRAFLREAADAFVDGGGYFGSTNTDTDDPEEMVSVALAVQVLLGIASHLGIARYRDFALEACLPRLRRFHMADDRNGQPTRGLLFLSDSYSSACLWECSEAALAYFRAAQARGHAADVLAGLSILRGIARNHHGPLGFLPSELDWNGRMAPDKHLVPGRYGPRAVTHPYMNNLHVVTSTLFYLENIAATFDEAAALAGAAGESRGGDRA